MGRYAYAGHPNILLFEYGSWSELSTAVEHGVPAGIVVNAQFYQYEHKLNTGDCILLYTDGATEIRMPAGKPLATQGSVEMLNRLGHLDPQTTIVKLVEGLVKLNRSDIFVDDVTVVLLEFT